MLLASRTAAADFANSEAIHDHIDTVLGRLDLAKLDTDQRRSLRADRLSLSLGILIPIYGSYALEKKMFGGLRPTAVVFDWILGAIVPVRCQKWIGSDQAENGLLASGGGVDCVVH